MNSVFRKQFDITAIHLDRFGRTKPSVLLHFAQEAAGGHCMELGMDWQTLAKRNLFWAVMRQKMQILRLPTEGETVYVETWPMPTTRSAFPRATVGYDAQGNPLFRVIGLWVLMDRVSRVMVLPGKSGIDLTGTVRGGELSVPGSIVPKMLEHSVSRKVGYTELDQNGHVNNARYLDWIDDLLPSEFHKDHPMQAFTICYLSEAREADNIDLHWQVLEDGCLQVEGYRTRTDVCEKNNRVFSGQVFF